MSVGTDRNFELGRTAPWEHFYLKIPPQLIDNTRKSLGELYNEYTTTKDVLQGSLDKISEDSILSVLELIDQNSLYKGAEWKGALTAFLKLKKEYDGFTGNKNNFLWEKSLIAGVALARIKNHSIGTLLLDLSDDVDLDAAVRKYEKIVAPENYKRPNTIYTKQMLEKAKEALISNGLMDSLQRRYATIEDINVNNILFSNRDTSKKLLTPDLFDSMMKEVAVDPIRYLFLLKKSKFYLKISIKIICVP
jgi:hypothetical protein